MKGAKSHIQRAILIGFTTELHGHFGKSVSVGL